MLTWNLPSLSFNSSNFNPFIEIIPDTNLVIGDTLYFTVTMMGVDTQFVSTYAVPVVNSYDPNDITPTPAGTGTERCIDQNQKVIYKIRFQNTGSAEAINVLVTDTIPAEYDLSSLRVLNSSHSVITELSQGNVLLFRFDDIYLADSASNEKESHGFILFQLNQQADLPIGTVINNSASIYFDYNEPVLTNTAFNTICNLNTGLTEVDKNKTCYIYPNPASSVVNVSLSEETTAKVQLISITGNVVFTKEIQHSSFLSIPVSDIAAGFYILRIQSGDSIWTSKVLKP